jgi:nucleotide-binding universal stress UspA family protein
VKTILVVANETLGGAKLLEKMRERAGGGDARVVVYVPRTNPRHGNVIYDESVFDAAQVRIDLARQVLREEGIDAVGEVGDPDPYTATMDAIAEYDPDEVIVSTYPAASSGWLRRDLIGRIRDAAGVPVEHVVSDIDAEGLPYEITLVAANRTANDPALLEFLKQHAAGGGRRLFIFVVPQEGGQGLDAQQAHARLAQVLDRARSAGLLSAGMIGDPDPYTAIMNALQFFRVQDIVISTLPATRSGWLRADLVERVRRASGKPVDHVEGRQSAPAEAA